MGENKHIEELDAFAKKYIKEIAEEKPSDNFTENIMEVVLSKKSSKVFQTNYNFSYSIWMVFVGFIAAVVYLVFRGKSTKIAFPEFDIKTIQLPDFEMKNLLDGISFSTTTVYAFLILAFLFAIQGYFLKHYFEKPFE